MTDPVQSLIDAGVRAMQEHESRYDADRVLAERWVCAECDWAGRTAMAHDAHLAAQCLDAFLADPASLIAVMVERGVLEQTGWRSMSGKFYATSALSNKGVHAVQAVPVFRLAETQE